MRDAMDRSFRSLRDGRIRSAFDDRGQATNPQMELPDGVNPEMAGQLASSVQQSGATSIPFPAEPVGVGGGWTVVQRIDSNGLPLLQRFDCRLDWRSATGAVIGLRMRQYAAANRTTINGAATEIISIGTGGHGRAELAFDTPVPRIALDVAGEIRTNVQTALVTTSLEMHLESQPAAIPAP